LFDGKETGEKMCGNDSMETVTTKNVKGIIIMEKNPIDEKAFRNLVNTILCPLLGAYLHDDSLLSTSREHEASILETGGGTVIVLKPYRNALFKLKMARAQKFSKDELKIAKDFCSEISKISNLDDAEYKEELIQNISNRIVVKQFPIVQVALKTVLSQFNIWSSQTYEGKQIVYSIGISPIEDNVNDGASVILNDLWKEPFAPVLTNGYDTFLKVSQYGHIIKFDQLNHIDTRLLAPYRLQALADWAVEDNVAVVLNQHGEILIVPGRNK
jgi:hypothetical protein